MTKKTTAIGLATLAAALVGTGVAVAAPGDMRQPPADMTRAQASAKANERFDRMDANKDGKLDAADRAARQAQMFDKIDTDKNGSISRAEFDAHHAQMGQQRGQRMGKHHRGGRNMGDEAGGRMAMMGRADANGDRALSREEFVNTGLARFDRMDANKDGTVTVAERQAAHQAMRGKWHVRQDPGPVRN